MDAPSFYVHNNRSKNFTCSHISNKPIEWIFGSPGSQLLSAHHCFPLLRASAAPVSRQPLETIHRLCTMKKNGVAHKKKIQQFVTIVKNRLPLDPNCPDPHNGLNAACKEVVANTNFKWESVKKSFLRSTKVKEKSWQHPSLPLARTDRPGHCHPAGAHWIPSDERKSTWLQFDT